MYTTGILICKKGKRVSFLSLPKTVVFKVLESDIFVFVMISPGFICDSIPMT